MIAPGERNASAAVLYVDDERANRIVFEQSFGRAIPVITLASGEEALKRLEEGGIGVVVTDQRMPGMTGNKLLEQVRARHPDIVRIVITAYSDIDDILRAVNDGLVARYIVKPWERGELGDILRWALEVHAKGHEDSAVQARLIQVERLVTLGGLAAALFHDVAQPIGVAEINSARLGELVEGAPPLSSLTRTSGALTPREATGLRDLADEIGPIAADLTTSLSHARHLLEKIRMLARVPLSGEPRRVHPTGTLRFVAGACRSLAVRARAALDFGVPDDLPAIAMTSTELTQVAMNVVSNAIQAVEEGERSGGRVRVTTRADRDGLALEVEDDGPGIPAELMSKIGRPFVSTRPEGTGLGVAQCRRILEAVGGSFRIESTVGKGTRVFVRAPWAEPDGPTG